MTNVAETCTAKGCGRPAVTYVWFKAETETGKVLGEGRLPMCDIHRPDAGEHKWGQVGDAAWYKGTVPVVVVEEPDGSDLLPHWRVRGEDGREMQAEYGDLTPRKP